MDYLELREKWMALKEFFSDYWWRAVRGLSKLVLLLAAALAAATAVISVLALSTIWVLKGHHWVLGVVAAFLLLSLLIAIVLKVTNS